MQKSGAHWLLTDRTARFLHPQNSAFARLVQNIDFADVKIQGNSRSGIEEGEDFCMPPTGVSPKYGIPKNIVLLSNFYMTIKQY